MHKAILALTKTMQYKLDNNKHKDCPVMNPEGDGRGWSHCSVDWLFGRLCDETIELEEALKNYRGHSPTNILEECADIANFAMMIHDNITKETE